MAVTNARYTFAFSEARGNLTYCTTAVTAILVGEREGDHGVQEGDLRAGSGIKQRSQPGGLEKWTRKRGKSFRPIFQNYAAISRTEISITQPTFLLAWVAYSTCLLRLRQQGGIEKDVAAAEKEAAVPKGFSELAEKLIIALSQSAKLMDAMRELFETADRDPKNV
jgi:hypothetical protein